MQNNASQTNGFAGTREFSITNIMNIALASLTKNKKLIASLFLIFLATSIVLGFLQYINGERSTLRFAFLIPSVMISAFIQASLSYGVFASLKNESISLGECFKVGSEKLIPVTLTTLLFGLGIFVASIFLLVPGIILMCVWVAAVPACAVEGLGAIDSLKRSAFLTKGNRWKIFFLMVVSVVAVIVVYGLLFMIAYLTGSVILSVILSTILSTLIQFYFYSMYVVTYFELRSIKEGVDLDKLVTVFE